MIIISYALQLFCLKICQDSSGFRVAGKTQWLHVASTQTETYYHVSPKRKSLLDGLSGTVIHDQWKSYYNLFGVKHELCNQHHLRMMKCKQKISGGFRSTQGAEQFARIRGFISTIRKRGFNILYSIESVFSGNMLIPAGW